MEFKHSDIVIRVTMVLLCAALLGYLGLFAYESLNAAPASAVATRYTWREEVELTGLIVRQETVLSSRSLYTGVTAPNGQRVAAGDTLGLAYSSQSDRDRARRMRDLAAHITLAEEILSGTSEENTAAERAENARSAVLSLSSDITRHELSSLRGDTLRMRSLIFDDGAAVTRQELSELRAEMREMRAQGEVVSEALLSPASGLFTSLLDGGESLDPAVLTSLTVGSLKKLMNHSPSVDGRAYGKLVTSSEWYLAALLGEEDAAHVSEGDELWLDLSRYRTGLCPVKVLSVSPASEGQCAVLLVSDRSLEETLELRNVDCPLVLWSVTGLRLPSEALQQGEGGWYVTVDTGSAGRRCSVELLYDGGDFVVVQGAGLSEGNAVEIKSSKSFAF